jgi:hypothetical protein
MEEKNKLDKFPPLSKELIEEMNKLFPELSADLKWSEKEVWFRSGQRSIIRFLNSHFLKQQDNIMEKN